MGPMKAKRKPKPSRITTSKSSAETEKRQRKVQIFLEKATKIWRYQEMQKKSGRWAEFLWPPQNMWSLKTGVTSVTVVTIKFSDTLGTIQIHVLNQDLEFYDVLIFKGEKCFGLKKIVVNKKLTNIIQD